ncbi:hypothetical protein IT084_04405 [Desulfallas sp. Bu1-1]|uniref:hypothetical protein n=1 Tax=Desulfallas sp. Bu1-1 TaxID=2787620 RepID=UPI00189DFAB8|nr:hypothetical protein [Desulfallas sp. Bu1-1]MBF7082216.1 hypothetical protein [Desulfallas sp. Bu1-1]
MRNFLPCPVINIGIIKINVVQTASMINIGINLPMETSSYNKINRGVGDNFGDYAVVPASKVYFSDNDREDFQVHDGNIANVLGYKAK